MVGRREPVTVRVTHFTDCNFIVTQFVNSVALTPLVFPFSMTLFYSYMVIDFLHACGNYFYWKTERGHA